MVLYEALTGRTPFGTGENINPLAIAMKNLSEPAPSPRAASPKVPEALGLITLTLMRKRPEERYPDANALAADLAAFLEGRGPSSTAALRVAYSPEGAATCVLGRAPVPPPRRRRRKVLPLTALALAAVLALLVSSPAQMASPVAFVGRTITSDAQTLDRASGTTMEAPPSAPRAPEGEGDEAPTEETQKPDSEPQTADTQTPAAAEVQTGSASASAVSSASPAPVEEPAASATGGATSSASASPAPTEESGATPAPRAAPRPPDTPAPVEGPVVEPPVVDEPAEVEMPEVETPEVKVPDF